MNLLDSFFSGAKVFVKEFVTVVGAAVKVILEEIDRSSFGKAVTQFVQGANRKFFSQAEDLAGEERELAEKFERDRKRSAKDIERQNEINAEREKLRKEMEAAKAQQAAEEFESESNNVVATDLNEDELSATVGLLASKICPTCGGTMRIRQTGMKRLNDGGKKRDFTGSVRCQIGHLALPLHLNQMN